jgi:murein DD-endopeptidase MepM/ murein hydrolase activator NlpD
MRTALVIAVLIALAPTAAADGAPSPRLGTEFAVPLYGTVLQPYDAPDNPYAAGHRGIDLAAPEGTPVRASAPGTVSFVGSVAGNLTVSVAHDAHLKTSYSYLGSASVTSGEHVDCGTVVGVVGKGRPHSGWGPNVHLSARRDGVYFDPLELYTGTRLDDLIDVTG